MELGGELARRVLDAVPDPTLIATSEGRIRFANVRTAAVFGYDSAELVGRDIEMLLPYRFQHESSSYRKVFFEDRAVRPARAGLEVCGLHKDGREFSVEISLHPMGSGDELSMICVMRDITAQREAASTVAEAKRARNWFLAAASHDLRQPLQALNLLNRAALTAGVWLLPTILERQQGLLDTMSELLDSLLDMSRLDSGMIVPLIERFAVDDTLDSVHSAFEGQAHARGIGLTIRHCGEAARTDRKLLTQLLMNLVANAVRYTDAGHVTVVCRREGSMLRFDVTDTGIGIAAGDHDRIFDEFCQVDRGSRREEGLGLGLSIVRRIAVLLGYQISVDSVPGRGSTFSVLVPASETSARSEPPPNPRPRRHSRVLIIDDEVAVADATRLMLEAEGFSVDVVSCASEALASVTANVPDLIVSDCHLRAGETGGAVVRTVRQSLHRNIPVVFVTGDTTSTPTDRSDANDRFLTKPVRGSQLIETLHCLLPH